MRGGHDHTGMTAAARPLAALALLWAGLLGCSVSLEGAACQDDLHCPSDQRCKRDPASDVTTCVQGARAAEHLEESCLAVMDTLARKAEECIGGEPRVLFDLVQAEGICASVKAGVDAERLEFLPDAHGQCLRDLRALSCGEVTLEALSQGRLLTQACEAFRPKVAEGGACTSPAECQDGWCATVRQTCDAGGACTTAASCPGVCKRYAALQAPCSDLEQCQPGSQCVGGRCQSYAGPNGACGVFSVACDPRNDTFCDAGACKPRRAQGASCADAAECARGLACVRDAPGSNTRTCQPALAPGSPCTPRTAQCEPTLHCNPATSRCEAWPSLGGVCELRGSEDLAYCVGSRCQMTFIPFAQTCVPFVPAGGACGSALDCGPLAQCRSGLCAPLWCQ